MPTLEVRTPFSKAPARQASPDVWRKKVLPVGDIEYKGRTLHFTPQYLQTLAASFTAGAYDQVPFQIADAQNTHTNHPEQYRGEIVRMDVEPDGLYVTAKTTPEGSRLLLTNPKLGVSARIVEGYDRSDGKSYPAAIQHVLGTLDPRIPGLGVWEAVEMSNTGQPEYVIDLSAATFAGEEEGGITMPELDAGQQDRLARLLELDPDKLDALISGIENGAADGAEGYGYDADDATDDELAALIDDMDDESFVQLLAEYDVELPAGREPVGAALANDYGLGDIELANYRIAETERQMAAVNAELDRQRFMNEKRQLMNLGVPGLIVDLAQPLLEGAGHVVELSNGNGVDAGRVIRDVLVEYAKQASLLDLSFELGSPMDEPDVSQTAEQDRRDFVARYRQVTGI